MSAPLPVIPVVSVSIPDWMDADDCVAVGAKFAADAESCMRLGAVEAAESSGAIAAQYFAHADALRASCPSCGSFSVGAVSGPAVVRPDGLLRADASAVDALSMALAAVRSAERLVRGSSFGSEVLGSLADAHKAVAYARRLVGDVP